MDPSAAGVGVGSFASFAPAAVVFERHPPLHQVETTAGLPQQEEDEEESSSDELFASYSDQEYGADVVEQIPAATNFAPVSSSPFGQAKKNQIASSIRSAVVEDTSPRSTLIHSSSSNSGRVGSDSFLPPSALKRALERFDSKFYFGSTAAKDHQNSNSLPQVVLRFETEVGNKILSFLPDPLLTPKAAFFKYVASPLYSPLIISAFGRHLRDSDAYAHWSASSSPSYTVRVNDLQAQFTPDLDGVEEECFLFLWNDKETAEALLRRADALAYKSVVANPSFRSYSESDRLREKDRRLRELLVSALRVYPTQFAALTSWTVSHVDGNNYPIADFLLQLKGQMSAIQRLRRFSALPGSAETEASVAALSLSQLKPPDSSPHDNSNSLTSRAAHTIYKLSEGRLRYNQIKDKAVLQVIDALEDKGATSFRKCASCRAFVGALPQLTEESCESHLPTNCPHKDAITRSRAYLQTLYFRS